MDGSRHTALEVSTIKNTCLLLSEDFFLSPSCFMKQTWEYFIEGEADGQTANFTRRRTISIHEEATFIMTPCDSVKLETEPSWSEGREVMTGAEMSA